MRAIESRSVSFWCVHTFVAAVLNQVDDWPMLGTLAWRDLSCDDPRKWAALLDAAQHWALHIETRQEALAEASHDVSAAEDWGWVGRQILRNPRRSDVYISREVVS